MERLIVSVQLGGSIGLGVGVVGKRGGIPTMATAHRWRSVIAEVSNPEP